MEASSLVLTPGDPPGAAPTGKIRLFAKNGREVSIIDPLGVETPLGQAGPQGEPGPQGIQGEQGIPGPAGSGVGFQGLFYAKNDVWQSHASISILNIQWNTILKNWGSKFTRDAVNQDQIICNFDGWVEIATKIIMTNNSSTSNITVNSYVSKNYQWISYLQGFGWIRANTSGHKIAVVQPADFVQVAVGDILRVHTAMATDTTFNDVRDVSTGNGESTVTLKAYTEL